MRHFIGGAAVGLFFAILMVPKIKGESKTDWIIAALAHGFYMGLFGLIVWGLWP